jgi:hypothetical protein
MNKSSKVVINPTPKTRPNRVGNARKVTIDGITFDSIYESEVYKLLKSKLNRHPCRANLLIHPHHPIAFTGGRKLTRVHKSPTWKVDFFVTQRTEDGRQRPLFAVEAKGRFHQEDKFKCILWDIFQSVPLLVVYQGKFQATLQSSGWVLFLPTDTFKQIDIARQVDHISAINASRCQRKITF